LQKLFKDQIRAILRAATVGPARILVPLVTRTEQVDFVLETVDRARRELEREGLDFCPDVPIGIMIEVAAATPMVQTWAGRIDYFALGTNDLVASALGIDRDDPVDAGSNDPLHPGFLRLLRRTIQAAHRAERRVTVCGEMASDPEGMLALAAFQVDALSVAVNLLPVVRHQLALQPPSSRLKSLASELVRLPTAVQVRQFLRQLGRSRSAF
jgi:phosphoenolpyruvate-protein kinase (PTS system EI component)